jgi:predicted Holliday junction resolvase-like endonuclease
MLTSRISGQMAPLLPEFHFSSAYAQFIRSPIDFVVFDGYAHANYELGDSINVVLMNVKKGKGRLTRENAMIKRVGSGCHSRKKD